MKKGFLAVFAALAINASAMALDLRFSGMSLSNAETAKISVNGGDFKSVFVGEISFSSSVRPVKSYCVDALSPLNGESQNYQASQLVQAAPTNISMAATILANHQGRATSAAQQAGLQLAIWEALYDGGNTFDASNACFKVTGATDEALCYATEYYKSFNKPTDLTVDWYKTSAIGGQSQIEAVPEPMTVASLGVGLAALLRRRRKSS